MSIKRMDPFTHQRDEVMHMTILDLINLDQHLQGTNQRNFLLVVIDPPPRDPLKKHSLNRCTWLLQLHTLFVVVWIGNEDRRFWRVHYILLQLPSIVIPTYPLQFYGLFLSVTQYLDEFSVKSMFFLGVLLILPFRVLGVQFPSWEHWDHHYPNTFYLWIQSFSKQDPHLSISDFLVLSKINHYPNSLDLWMVLTVYLVHSISLVILYTLHIFFSIQY